MYMLSTTTTRTNQENRTKNSTITTAATFIHQVRMHQQQAMTFFSMFLYQKLRKKWQNQKKILLSIG